MYCLFVCLFLLWFVYLRYTGAVHLFHTVKLLYCGGGGRSVGDGSMDVRIGLKGRTDLIPFMSIKRTLASRQEQEEKCLLFITIAKNFLKYEWDHFIYLSQLLFPLCLSSTDIQSIFYFTAVVQARTAGPNLFHLVFIGTNGEPNLYITAEEEGQGITLTVRVFIITID